MILEKKSHYSAYKISVDALPEEFQAPAELYRELARRMPHYRAGLREVSARLESLDDRFQVENDHNPIHHMESRMKTAESILEKARRRGFPLTAEGILENVRDVAGLRVICNYIDDVYRLAELIMVQEGLKVLKVSDYIAKPKENGYRSLHIVVEVPVHSDPEVAAVPVEVQLRTIAMDTWASLEHEMIYKAKRGAGDIDRIKLKICADELADVDRYMQEIYKELC